MQKVKHIDIPFDELGVFKLSHQDHYQQVLMQTLLLTTVAMIHYPKKSKKSSLYCTTKHLWYSRKTQPQVLTPLRSIIAVLKSAHHPEMVIMTGPAHDNIRLTTSSQDRCWYIISALSYVTSYVHNDRLRFVSIQHSSLDYYQRTSQQKAISNISIDWLPQQMVAYQKPFHDMTHIYGHIRSTSRVILQKQVESAGVRVDDSHQVYLARIRDQSKDNPEKEDRYICHYVAKKQSRLEQLYEHRNVEYISELIYAKTSEFKIQIFFQFSLSLRQFALCQQIAAQIWELHHKAKNLDPDYVLTTDLLAVVSRKSQVVDTRLKMQQGLSPAEQLQKWRAGEFRVVLLEFRYEFLNGDREWDRFMYEYAGEGCQDGEVVLIKEDYLEQLSRRRRHAEEEIKQKQEQQTSNTSRQLAVESTAQEYQDFKSKLYNFGLILYQLATGRHLLSYMPDSHQQDELIQSQVQMIESLKKAIHSKDMPIFPKFMQLGVEPLLQDFINKCLWLEFGSCDQMINHQWWHCRPQ